MPAVGAAAVECCRELINAGEQLVSVVIFGFAATIAACRVIFGNEREVHPTERDRHLDSLSARRDAQARQ
jgi:hypothetical protein